MKFSAGGLAEEAQIISLSQWKNAMQANVPGKRSSPRASGSNGSFETPWDGLTQELIPPNRDLNPQCSTENVSALYLLLSYTPMLGTLGEQPTATTLPSEKCTHSQRMAYVMLT